FSRVCGSFGPRLVYTSGCENSKLLETGFAIHVQTLEKSRFTRVSKNVEMVSKILEIIGF
ncbi:MAG: hypothetical protein IKX81_06330, partial [Firmicutes bacterium]|nr:hypothetical protein [Bacillota bacterium]